MGNYKLLLNIFFKQGYRLDSGKKKKSIMYLIIAGVCILPLIALLCITMYTYASLAYADGLAQQFISFLCFAGVLIVFVFGIFSIMNYMFLSKDAEFLSTMPVKRSTLFLSKLTMVYVNEIGICTLFLLPSLIVTGIAFSASIWYFLLSIIAVLLIPLIPLLILSILSFPLMYIVTFFKNRSALTGVVLMILFAGVFAGYYGLIGNLSSSGDEVFSVLPPVIVSLMSAIDMYFYPIPWLSSAMVGTGAWYNIILFVASFAVVLILATVFCSKLYFRSVMAQAEGSGAVKRKNTELASSSCRKALFKKDFLELVRNPSFALNSFLGVILTPIIIVFMFRSFNMAGDETSSILTSSIFNCGLIVFYCMIILCGTNYTATAAFTREGRNFYTNKTLPVDYSIIMKNKLLLANIVSFIGCLLCSLVTIIFTTVGIINGILLGVALLLFCVGANLLGIKRDLKRPKLNWNNANEAIKNNFYMMMPMFISMVIGVVLLAVSIVLPLLIVDIDICNLVFWAIVFALAGISFAIPALHFNEGVKECFERIEP